LRPDCQKAVGFVVEFQRLAECEGAGAQALGDAVSKDRQLFEPGSGGNIDEYMRT
tara:strand:+ start:113 stop:277 length:165 start_codon:yes stop_codon:yes gene_type:complete